MKKWRQILQETIYHPAQDSPDQAPANQALKLTSSGKDLGKSDRSLSRLQLNFVSPLMTIRSTLLLVVATLFITGCGQRREATRLETVTEVTLFDSEDGSYPSPRDSRWALTNSETVARISPIARQSDIPVPLCPAVGSIQTTDAQGRTNRYFMIHIHFPKTIRLDGVGVIQNGDVLLTQFARVGIPTNKLFAVSGEH